MEAFEAFLSTEFLGISIAVLLAFILGMAIACNEGIRFKFNQYKQTSGNSSAVFDKKYLISGVVALIVCGITVWIVFAYNGAVANGVTDGLVGQLQTFFTALAAVLTEALVLIKACNRRLDTLFLGGSDDGSVDAEEAKKVDEFELKTL